MNTVRKLIILLTIASMPATLISQQITTYKFSFGPAKEAPGYIKVKERKL